MKFTQSEIEREKEMLKQVTPGPWIIGDDGWPIWWDDGKGSLPVWFSSIDESENNPYRPYTISFPTLKFIADARTAYPAALEEIEYLRKALEDMGAKSL